MIKPAGYRINNAINIMKSIMSFRFKNALTFIIVICALSIGFSACSDDEEPTTTTPTAKVLSNYFIIQDASLVQGAIPSNPNGRNLGQVSINANAIAGGTSIISINSQDNIQKLYVSVKGANSYYSITPSLQKNTIFDFVLLFSQNLSDPYFELQVTALFDDGTTSPIYTTRVTIISAGTGGLQISLSFDNEKDIDLYVVQPDGEVIYYGNKGEGIYDTITGEYIYSWGLDLDSNPGCYIDSINNENVFYPTEYIQAGTYQVWVNMYANCDESIPTNWAITALKAGQLVTPSYGNNPAIGVYPIGEPSNGIGSELTGALKVMEFTMTGITPQPTKIKKSSPLSPSAKMKLQSAGVK
jgi:hypothetical protein